jgi:hypothetical protein
MSCPSTGDHESNFSPLLFSQVEPVETPLLLADIFKVFKKSMFLIFEGARYGKVVDGSWG